MSQNPKGGNRFAKPKPSGINHAKSPPFTLGTRVNERLWNEAQALYIALNLVIKTAIYLMTRRRNSQS